MKKIFLVLLILSFATSVMAGENSAGLKASYNFFDSREKSQYEGNNIYKSDYGIGGYLKHQFSNPYYKTEPLSRWIMRLDIDYLRSGNEFKSALSVPYERMRIEQMPLVLSIGKQYKGFYGLIGAGVSFNKVWIEEYPTNPFSYKAKNSRVYSYILGYEHTLKDKWYWFIEGRYLYNKVKIDIAGGGIWENASNKGISIGLAYKF